jgi:hypothetical protein
MMPGVTMTVETLADEICKHVWTGEQYRHFELGVHVRNDGQEAAEEVSVEICLPEASVLDFNASAWKPSHRHEIDGIAYVVWSTWGYAGLDVFSIPPNWSGQCEKLAVNVKPYVQNTSVRYRLFERGDPLTDWLKTDVTFKPFAPRL